VHGKADSEFKILVLFGHKFSAKCIIARLS